jgi:hypothetical protein
MRFIIRNIAQFAVGDGDRINDSSSTTKQSARGTSLTLPMALIKTFVSVYSRILEVLVVGDTLTNGLSLI